VRRLSALLVAAGLAVLPAAGCSRLLGGGGDDALQGDPSQGIAIDESESVLEFQEQASRFYGRLSQRRFNVVSTWQDELLRDHFQSEAAFADWYSDLAQQLADAHFERNRPLALEVLEFAVDAPGRARVTVRIEGDDGRPLRPGATVYEREDRWERVGGRWWIVPGRL
jgi:hypothetical protein